MVSPKLPNFLVIGSAKSGTTALFEYLEQHPEVFLCDPKEPHFLALEGPPPSFQGPGDAGSINRKACTSLERYQQLFARAQGARAIGEASVSTMYYPESIERIKKYVPQAKLICILRQPAERAYSAFSFMHTRMLEPCQDFRAALADEERRIAAGWHHIWHYRRMGYYYQQLKPYFDAFGRDRIKVYLFEDLRRNPQAILRDCFNFLEIDASFVPPHEPNPHPSGMPRSRLLQAAVAKAPLVRQMLKAAVPLWLKRKLQKSFVEINLQRVKMSADIQEELTQSFCDDIARLQDLLDRDLSKWLALPEPVKTA
jgi:hypothetical protein